MAAKDEPNPKTIKIGTAKTKRIMEVNIEIRNK